MVDILAVQLEGIHGGTKPDLNREVEAKGTRPGLQRLHPSLPDSEIFQQLIFIHDNESFYSPCLVALGDKRFVALLAGMRRAAGSMIANSPRKVHLQLPRLLRHLSGA